jgi:hypothetical protein
MKQMYTGYGRIHPGPLKMAALAALLATTGCVSAPAETDIPMTSVSTVNVPGFVNQQLTNDVSFFGRTLPLEAPLIWGVLPGVYEELGIPVSTSNPETMQVGNLGFEVQRIGGSRMNKYLNCGTGRIGPMANAYQVTLTVLTKLVEVEGAGTEVLTLVKGNAVNRSTAGYPVSCRSRETLEEMITDRVAEALGISGS